MGSNDTAKRARDTFNGWPDWKKDVALTKYSSTRSLASGSFASQRKCGDERTDKISCSPERSTHKV